jgi:hypothetical protein
MPALPPIRNLNLKVSTEIVSSQCFTELFQVIFLTHFIFIALSSMGFWSTSAFLFYNFFLILFLVWSIYQPQSEEPVQLVKKKTKMSH